MGPRKSPKISRIYQSFVRNKWCIFLLWSLWLTLEYFGLGPFSYFLVHDWGDSVLPMRLGLVREFFDNGFSYWTNTAACGLDRLASTGPFFQVDNLFLLTLPGWSACALVAFLQRFLAGYFTYRLCRDYLKLDELPSLVAGLAYSICFFYFQSSLMGGAGFPFILWSLERISERKKVTGYIFAVLLGLFVLFSSSFVLSIPFMLPMVLAWFVLVRRKYSFHFLSLFAVFSATLLAGEIPYIRALLVNAPLSHRADWDLAARGDPWMSQLGRIIGFLKTNIVYLILGILGLYLSRLKDRSLVMVIVLLVFCGALAGLYKTLLPYFGQHISFFVGFQFDRFYLLTPFFAVITAAYGLHFLHPVVFLTQGNPHKHRIQTILNKYRIQTISCLVVISLLVVNSFILKYDHYCKWAEPTSTYAANYENADLEQIASNIDSVPFRVGTVAFYIHPACASAYGLETVDGYVSLYPQRYQDFWGKVIEPLISRNESLYHYFHNWGSRIYLFADLVAFPPPGEDLAFSKYYNLNLLSLANMKYLISGIPVSNEHLELLTLQEAPGDEVYGPYNVVQGGYLSQVIEVTKRNMKGRHLYIYENEICFPRFFLSGKVKVFENSHQLLEAMAKADINSLRNNVFVEEKFLSEINLERLGVTDGELTIEQYSPDRIILSVELDNPGILIVSNSYNPYWICKVDGVDKDIFPAYHTFMGIFLEEGEHLVQLEYRPPYRAFW